jgi:hypothetical protein
LEIEQAPSELPANLPFSSDVFAPGSSNSKGACSISNKKILDHFSPSFLSQKCLFQELRVKSTYRMSSNWCVAAALKFRFSEKAT